MKPVFLGAVLLFLGLARANDSSFEGVGGSVRPTKGENKAIRMKSEFVVLTAGANDFSTRADFVFQNATGRAQTVQMGFPEGNYGDVASAGAPEKTTFTRFATWVDGQKFVAKRTTLRDTDASGFSAYWLKTVRFAPHQTRRVRVEILAPYGGAAQWGLTNALSYEFTGANWRGNVARSTLEVRVSQPGLWRTIAMGGQNQILPMTLSSNGKTVVWRHVWTNWPAQESVTFGLERALPFWKMDAGALSDRQLTLKMIRASQTVRVGAKPEGFEPTTGGHTPAFSRGGVLYVSVSHLTERLETWGRNANPPINLTWRYDLATRSFSLKGGATSLFLRQGSATATVNGHSIALGAPVESVPDGGDRSLYLPLRPVARALGLSVKDEGERLFRLERGAWKPK